MVAESPEDDSGGQVRLHSLTGLRFYAALAIVLRHVVPPIMGVPWATLLVAVGPVGVGFFFVLSGFVLAWGYRPDVGCGAFWMRRVARVYPLHLVTTAAAVAVALAAGHALYPGSALLTLTLLQSWFAEGWRHGGNTVSWSLSCEAFFYACFPFVIAPLRRLGIRAAVIAIVATMAAMGVYVVAYTAATLVSDIDLNALSPYSNPAYRIGEFLIGILLARLLQQGVRAPVSLIGTVWLAGAALAVLAVGNAVVMQSGRMAGGVPLFGLDLLFLPFASLLILAAASSDLRGVRSVFAGPRHVALGQWSFALYLIHTILLTAVLEAMTAGAGSAVRGAVLAVVVVASVLVSGFTYRVVEAPCEAWIRRGIPRR